MPRTAQVRAEAGRCRPGVRRAVRGRQEWGVGGRHRSRAYRWGRGTRVLWVREPLLFLPENRKKIRNFSLFFCDPGLLSDFSAGGQRSRHIGRGPRPRPNLPKEGEIFSKSGRPVPAGFPVFGKTEN